MLRALVRVGLAVQMAVERFVSVGETIAEENREIEESMCEACKEARLAGGRIQKLTDMNLADMNTTRTMAEKTAMVRAARQLLSAITKVLLLADRVVVKQLLLSKDKVLKSLVKIENVSSFTDFVKAFSQFGNEMVELAHLSGDRQNDLKNDKARAQMGSARSVLERSTMMLLTTSKTLLRHQECDAARKIRNAVFFQMRRALERIDYIVTNGVYSSNDLSPSTGVDGDSGISLSQQPCSAFRLEKEFQDLIDLTRVTYVNAEMAEKLRSALDVLVEATQDFTDSAYTSHENRERVLLLTERLRHELGILLKMGACMEQKDLVSSPTQQMETAILKTRAASRNLKNQLQDTAMDQSSDVFKSSDDHQLLTALKTVGLTGDIAHIAELSVKFEEHSDQLQEVCKLLRHIASTEPLAVWAEHTEALLKTLAPQILLASETLSLYPTSKIAKENMDVFCDAWASLINDLSVLVKDINDACQGKSDRHVYLSLPRPGKHGTTVKTVKPVKLNAEEQAKIAKLGLEMKLITSEMDAETEKWEEPDNEVVRRAKNMSSMAFSMYLFTRGEGPLKTTQDLFTQAEYFAEEGTKLYRIVYDFAQHVPQGAHRTELLSHLDRLPTSCQQLMFTIKSPTVGKAATFNKVDSVIQETKNLMNGVAKVVTTCFICTTKYNIDYRGLQSRSQHWRSSPRLDLMNGGSDSESSRSGCSRSESLREPGSYKARRTHSFQRSSSLTRPVANYSSFDRI
ncbi:hypothetical protein NP493_1106g00015 [Ridgeia piscesae]|uniref:Alpha-catulin n=1 Tax=Ridgeia piscesae TaxID=27915 RepID=A0AAD9KG83_RIDPI|nr:hypothetical protein NP493_1106g00015 [Ridgeia piscesae]